MHVFLRSFLLRVLALGALAGLGAISPPRTLAAPGASADATFVGPDRAGALEAPPRREASGLAASRRNPGLWWVHDDSGGAPVLYAVDDAGKLLGAVRLAGVKNNDWEDLAAFSRDGRDWLLVADTGDNNADRKTVQLHLLAEPARAALARDRETSATPAWSLRVRYPDGPHDCEAVAVDAREGAIYLLTKRENHPRLYRVPLAPAAAPVEAQLVLAVTTLDGDDTTSTLLKALVGKKYDWPTSMDFAPDGSAAVVLTYGNVLVFPRHTGESWAAAFGRTPQRLGYHGLPQAEGVAFSAEGASIRVVSEGMTDIARYVRR
jgi:hypothetical protein